jgi:hypothetical protein
VKINRKYTAIAFTSEIDDASIIPSEFCHGFNRTYRYDEVKTEFDTEDEAIKYAYNMFPKSKWLIVPVVIFEEENE